jgi:hypothetical protein
MPMSKIGSEKRVLMTKRVAARWLRAVSFPEHRIRVIYGAREIRNLTSLLQSFRDGRVAMVDVPRVADLGIKTSFDGIELWSKDRTGLMALGQWFEKRGFETTGIW